MHDESVLEKEAQVLHGLGDWRSAHSWLKGYSDGHGAGIRKGDGTYDPAAYDRGFAVGERKAEEWAMARVEAGAWTEA